MATIVKVCNGTVVKQNTFVWLLFKTSIKANKIVLYGTQDSQHPIRTAATKRWQLMTGWLPCEFALHSRESCGSSEPKATKSLCLPILERFW